MWPTSQVRVEKKKDDVLYEVRTLQFKETVLAICHERADDWAEKVKARLLFVNDLPAADAVYHQQCSVNFRTNKNIPAAQQKHPECSSKTKLGRPIEDERTEAFLDVASFLEENDYEQITITDLVDVMKTKLLDSDYEAYSYNYMKQKLQQHFGDIIILTDINGKPNVVTFRTTARKVLQDYYSQRKEDPEEEKIRLVEAAAKIIKEDIKSAQTLSNTYPSCNVLQSSESCLEYLPESLRILLEGLFAGKHIGVKVASIGQAIMQATRPRVILAPLLLGLGVQLHHHFSSRFLIDSLHQHGFCCSYQEVHQFHGNAAQCQ